MPKLAANLSMMFSDIDMLDRFEMAARVGFRGAEIQNPYAYASAEIAQTYRDNALEAVRFNTSPGVGAVPGLEKQFEGGIIRAVDYAEAAGCSQTPCQAGQSSDPRSEFTFVSNLQRASAQARPRGGHLLLKPLNIHDNPGYFLTGSEQTRRVIDLVGEDNVFLQYEIYHMQIMEGSLAKTLTANLDIISHIQIARVPVRREPGDTQEIPCPYLFDVLDDAGYDRWVACEYHALGESLAGLSLARAYGIEPSIERT
jgi:hydroxypyruvate isomerase